MPSDELLTTREVCELVRVSPQHLYRYRALMACRIGLGDDGGPPYRWVRSLLNRWLALRPNGVVRKQTHRRRAQKPKQSTASAA